MQIKKKTIEENYKLLDEISHVRQRPGMYVGSIIPTTGKRWVIDGSNMKYVEMTYNPGLCKIFCEILDNSIDEHKREPTKLNIIKVDIDRASGVISVYDNGGIPVVKHKDTNEYIPSMIFSNLRAGSNFDDATDQALVGTNGVGSTLVAILSSRFEVSSSDGKNSFSQIFSNGLRDKTKPIIKPSKLHFTKITFTPDYAYFSESGLTDDNYTRIIKRVYDCAGCNPSIDFVLNGSKIKFNSFKDYIGTYASDFIFEENENWSIGIAHASDGFEHVSFVNSVETFDGGSHIDYVVAPIVTALREYVNKKYKVDVKPADIRQHLMVFINCNVNRPKFNSQTKSMMVSEPKEYKTEWKPSEAFIKKLIKSNIVEEIVTWAENKKAIEDLAALKKKNKDLDKSSLRNITKYETATSKNRSNCILFLAEGDCLESSTPILTYRALDGTLIGVPIGELKIGDFVLTHNNRIREVVAKTDKVVEGYEFIFDNQKIIISSEHKMLTYNKITKQFGDTAAKDIDIHIHQFVRNRLVDMSHLSEILSIVPSDLKEFDLIITFLEEANTPTYSSFSHKFLVWDNIFGEFKLETASELEVGRHSMVMIATN